MAGRLSLGVVVGFCLLAPAAPAAPLYAAMGASDAVGTGATSPNTVDPSLPNNGYVYNITNWLRARNPGWALSNHGISGEEAPEILRDQLNPTVAEQPALVTLWAGGNDVKNSVLKLESTATLVARFTASFTTLIQTLRDQTSAHIVVANLPDMSKLPVAAYLPLVYRQLGHADAVALNGVIVTVAAQYNVPVLDLYSDPRSTDAANISSDGFHPNDNGYALMSQGYEAIILGDVDGSGGLSVMDAVLTLRIAGGIAEPTGLQRISADAWPPGGDRSIDASDAVQILRRIAGLVPETQWR